MKTTKPSLSLWTIWAPLKLGLIISLFSLIIMFTYSLITSHIYSIPSQVPETPLFLLLLIGFLLGIYLVIRKLPEIKMDRKSFVAIHSLQTVFSSVLVVASTYIILANHQNILIKIMSAGSVSSGLFLTALIITTVFLMFLIGISIINFYVKIRRIQDFNIPTWKILFSIPFGFSALWIPGYFLSNGNKKITGQQIESKTYSKMINWIITTPQNTIAAFTFITLFSCLGSGFFPALLTLSLTMFFGIWIMKVGEKQFIKHISDKYSTVAVIINIALVVMLSAAYVFMPQHPKNIIINISETTTIETPGNNQ